MREGTNTVDSATSSVLNAARLVLRARRTALGALAIFLLAAGCSAPPDRKYAAVSLAGSPAAVREAPKPSPAPATTAGPPAASWTPADAAAETSWTRFASSIHGSISAEYRGRFNERNSGADDHDLWGRVSLNAGDEQRDGWSATVRGALRADLNGRNTIPGDPFVSIDDSYSDRVIGLLYEAHADAVDLGPVRRIRVGRQPLEELAGVTLDGAYIETETGLDGLRMLGFGGAGVHFFETTQDVGDAIAGGGFDLRPSPETRIRGLAAWFRDRRDLPGLPQDVSSDLLFVLSGRQDLGRWGWLTAEYRQLKDRPYDGSMRFFFTPIEDQTQSLQLQAWWRGVFLTQDVMGPDASPFTLVLGTLRPYQEGGITADWALDKKTSVFGEFSMREVTAAGGEGPFNRSYQRLGTGLRMTDWPANGLTVSMAGQFWNTPEHDFMGVNGELEWRPTKEWRLRSGAEYTLYKYDWLDASEKTFVTSLWVDARFRAGKNWEWRLRYEHEIDDNFNAPTEHLDRLRAQATFTF
jgi:hypothetical protein